MDRKTLEEKSTYRNIYFPIPLMSVPFIDQIRIRMLWANIVHNLTTPRKIRSVEDRILEYEWKFDYPLTRSTWNRGSTEIRATRLYTCCLQVSLLVWTWLSGSTSLRRNRTRAVSSSTELIVRVYWKSNRS